MDRQGWGNTNVWSGFNYIPISEQLGNLYLGAWEFEGDEIVLIEELKKRKIGLVLGLGFEKHPLNKPECSSLGLNARVIALDIEDYSDAAEKMRKYITAHLGSIHESLLAGENVYVHCHAGISRSPTFVMAYLMEYHSYTLNEAYDHLRKHRPGIYPNPGFHRLLQELAC